MSLYIIGMMLFLPLEFRIISSDELRDGILQKNPSFDINIFYKYQPLVLLISLVIWPWSVGVYIRNTIWWMLDRKKLEKKSLIGVLLYTRSKEK